MCSIQIKGRLAEPASYRHVMGGAVLLIAHIDQGATAPAIVAEWPMGSGPAASYAANAAARAMPKGTEVTVHCAGIKAERYLGKRVQRLQLVSHIEHAAQAARHEPAAQAA
jgi:hypothetical protein